MNIEIGSVIAAVISMFLLSFLLWVIHKMMNI